MSNFRVVWIIIMLIMPSVAYSQIEIDGIEYLLNKEYREARVTYDRKYPYKKYRGNVVIPSSVCYNDTVYIVTEIGDKSFMRCNLLASITLPNTITAIGLMAFFKCEELHTIVIPEGVIEIGDGAFSSCDSLVSIVLPSTLQKIGTGAFERSYSLSSVSIPENVTKISPFTFADCWNLVSVSLPESIDSIGDFAFLNCNTLPSIVLPSKIKSIGDRAFDGCMSLKSITSFSRRPPRLKGDPGWRCPQVFVPKGAGLLYKLSKYWRKCRILYSPQIRNYHPMHD